jgi:hypothetical protein
MLTRPEPEASPDCLTPIQTKSPSSRFYDTRQRSAASRTRSTREHPAMQLMLRNGASLDWQESASHISSIAESADQLEAFDTDTRS